MFGFLWRRTHRRGNRTEVTDEGEHLATLDPSEASVMVERFNAVLADRDALRAERDSALALLRKRNDALRGIVEFSRPYVRDTPFARIVKERAEEGLK